MLAVNPPGRFVWDAEVIDEQIEDYTRLCAQDPECSARTGDLVASMRSMSENMPDRWLLFPTDEGVIEALTHVILYESIQPPGMPVPLSGLAAVDMWLAAIPQEYLQVQPTDVETLLISGSIDFAVPPQFATEELLPYLSNGEQVILKDFGHTSSFWNSQPEARAHMLNTFFDTGQVDASLYTYQPLDFDVGLGWPALAKLLVAVVVLVPILLLVLAWLLIRWVKRRRASQVSGCQRSSPGGDVA
jgi:pimeloyl-ACP methyl ester carboxylesterase